MDVTSLLGVSDRDLKSAKVPRLDVDNKFLLASNAARALCDLALRAEGYRAKKGLRQHVVEFESLEFTLGGERTALASYFALCGRKRNSVQYEMAGSVAPRDVDELVRKTMELRKLVLAWLAERHPGLVPPAAKAK